jgi:hypothetical protein
MMRQWQQKYTRIDELVALLNQAVGMRREDETHVPQSAGEPRQTDPASTTMLYAQVSSHVIISNPSPSTVSPIEAPKRN